MDLSARRVVGSLILLSGLTALAVGAYTGQLERVLRMVKEIFETALAGVP